MADTPREVQLDRDLRAAQAALAELQARHDARGREIERLRQELAKERRR